MQRFVFNLETLLELRLREEDEAKQDLADKENEYRAAQVRQKEAKCNLEAFQEAEKEQRQGTQTALQLRNSVSWRFTLKQEFLSITQQCQEIQVDINKSRERLIVATQKRKSLEILKDKKYAAWLKEYNKREQLFLDELAQNNYIRTLEKKNELREIRENNQNI